MFPVGAQIVREAAEAVEIETYLHEENGDDGRHHEIDSTCESHGVGLPIGLAQRGDEEFRRPIGGDHGPAARIRLDRRDRGEKLLPSRRVGVADGERAHLRAGIPETVEHAGVEQILALLLEVLGRDGGRGGHVVEGLVRGGILRAKEELDVGAGIAEVLHGLRDRTHGLAVQRSRRGGEASRRQAALAPRRFRAEDGSSPRRPP